MKQLNFFGCSTWLISQASFLDFCFFFFFTSPLEEIKNDLRNKQMWSVFRICWISFIKILVHRQPDCADLRNSWLLCEETRIVAVNTE